MVGIYNLVWAGGGALAYFAGGAIPIGFVLAIFLALGKNSPNLVINRLSRGYIYFFRGSPFFILSR